MGANYMLVRGDQVEHIGKASGRCRFIFRGEEGLTSFAAWKERLKEGQILGGSDEPVTLEEFEAMVEAKKDGRPGEYDFMDAEGNPFLWGEFS